MRISNLHTHTAFCDGSGSPEDFCQAAHAGRFASLGFSAHAPIQKRTGHQSSWHLPENRFTDYCNAVSACGRAWSAVFPVFLGLEADYIAGAQCPRDFSGLGLDYLIGSVHCVVPRQFVTALPAFTGAAASPEFAFFAAAGGMLCVDGSAHDWSRLIDVFFNGDVWSLVDAYWTDVEHMIRSGGFDILGHLDLLKKNNQASLVPRQHLFDEQDPRYHRHITRIAETLAQTKIVVEINTGGINRGKVTEPYPSLSILKILRAHAIPITINSDAHTPQHLCGGYAIAVETARAAGYTEIQLFSGARNGEALWQPELLA
jgi:histidinol-phosphatase (PHP family)